MLLTTMVMVTLGAASASGAAIVRSNQTYSFTGVCTDCKGVGTGTLTLTGDYTLGSDITSANFVSFVYSSSILNSVVISVSDDGAFIEGSLPSNLPSTANISIGNSSWSFSSISGGSWSISSVVPEDFGPSHTWAGATNTNTPEPATMGMLGIGLVAVTFLGRRRGSRK